MIEKNVISSIFSKRMSELIDLRTENYKEILDGLRELSSFLNRNTPECRRNLRSLIEEQTISINKKFLDSYKGMKLSFDKVSSGIDEMNRALSEMKNSLAGTKHKTNALIEKTGVIQREIENVSIKQEFVTAIIDRFQITSLQISTLRNIEISSDIISVLDMGDEIIKDCRTILQAGNSNLAQDIIDQISAHQDLRIEKLVGWVRGKFNVLETTVLSSLLPEAMAKLQNKSSLFQQILEELSANRSIVLVRQFIDVLTLGGRPIEHRVTEPRRYVSDMLAWLHQTLPTEVEYINFLFKNCDNSDELIQQMLSKSTEGICHPLRVRVEHVLLGEENSHDFILLQDLYILLINYHGIFSQIISNSRLNNTILELSEVAEKTLLLSLQNKVTVLLSSDKEIISTNLAPSESTEQILKIITQLLNIHSVSQFKEKHILQIVSCAIDPLMNQITEAALKLPVIEMTIYLLNTFHFIETSLALFPFLDDRLERLKAQCDAQIDTLTSEQASALVNDLGLGPVYTILQGIPTKPLSKLPAMNPTKLSGISAKLQKFLAAPTFYQLPQLAVLFSTNHKLAVQKRSFTVISNIYESLYQAVNDPENDYESPNEILPISVDTVKNTLTNLQVT